MVLSTRENTSKERNTEKVTSNGLMVQPILESSWTTTSMDKDTMYGPTEETTEGSGETTRWRVKVSSPGKTEESMKDNTMTIRRKDMESFHGQMDVNTKEIGTMESNMERGSISHQLALRRRVNGKTERESDGSLLREREAARLKEINKTIDY